MIRRSILAACAAALLVVATTTAAESQQLNAKPTDSVAAQSKVDTIVKDTSTTHKVIVYYFHGNKRCVSCRKIEQYTQTAIDSGFAAELKSGALEWRVVNTDSSQNEHYLTDYQMYTKSVILSDLHGGKETRWKNLEKVWELLGDENDFVAYVRSELTPYLDPTK